MLSAPSELLSLSAAYNSHFLALARRFEHSSGVSLRTGDSLKLGSFFNCACAGGMFHGYVIVANSMRRFRRVDIVVLGECFF